jgi:hypothetical protein
LEPLYQTVRCHFSEGRNINFFLHGNKKFHTYQKKLVLSYFEKKHSCKKLSFFKFGNLLFQTDKIQEYVYR